MAENDITVASTTDEPENVEAAAQVTAEELAEGRTPAPRERNEEHEGERFEDRERPGKGGIQKRIDRLTREKYQHLDRIQQLEARLQEVEAATRPGTRHVAEGEPPTSAQRNEEPTERGPEASAEGHEQVRERASEPTPEARQVHARFARDFDAALPKGSQEREALLQHALRTEAQVGGIHPGVAELVMSMPNSIDVYAHLCTHPDDLRVLNASPSHAEALANVRYIAGVLTGVVQARSAPRPRASVTSRAPAPIKPTRGGASPSVSLEDSDYQTFKRTREQQEKNRYRY